MTKEQRNAKIDTAVDAIFETLNKDAQEDDKFTPEDVTLFKSRVSVSLQIWDLILPVIISDVVNAIATANANVEISKEA